MEFRTFNGLKVQRPSIDVEDLAEEAAAFKGEFDYDLARIMGGEQPGVSGEGVVAHSIISAGNLSDAKLGSLELSDVRFDNVNLSNAALREVTIRRTEFVGCRAAGLQVSAVQVADLCMERCQLDYATIRVDQIKNGAAFVECSFREALFVGDLTNVIFLDCDLTGAEFQASRAVSCDLRGSRLDDVRGLLTLRGAKISHDQALSVASLIATESGLTVAE